MHGARGARASQIVGQTHLGTRNLARARLSAQLKREFMNLRHARRPYRVAFRFQAAAGVHRHRAAEFRHSLDRAAASLAFGEKPQILERDDLGDRETIVNLDQVDVPRDSAPPGRRPPPPPFAWRSRTM